MKLYLVQHGDAVQGETDAARPLSQKGKRDVRRLGEFLARNGIAVSRIIHSGKLRAQQTAEAIASRLPTTVTVEARDGTAAGYDRSWLRNAVEERLDEADVERIPDGD